MDGYRLVVHKPAVENCLLNAVAENRFTETVMHERYAAMYEEMIGSRTAARKPA